LPLYYEDLKRAARRERRRVQAGHTLQTTALIHEAYLKLRDTPGFNDYSHFLRASALAMRHILVNRARDRLTAKRGGGAAHLPLDGDLPGASPDEHIRILEVNDALGRLAALNARLARVVECRFFAGYSETETAAALGVTDRTVRRDWTKARAWLLHTLSPDQAA
jgi:RNA polymerase sigma factor (TIGR02999 family)